MRARKIFLAAAGLGAAFAASGAALARDGAYAPQDYRNRAPEDEVIYFVLPDRFDNADPSNDQGGLGGDPLKSGFDPARKGFFHGGDLKGLTARLDYITGLGATAIWLGPIYKNKPVQGRPGDESAGYHGYWITDFTDVDPHFGTKADLKEFVDAAHARGVKIYLDIITNHSADVIALRECHPEGEAPANAGAGPCPYRSRADFPFTTQGGPGGRKINNGFMGDADEFQTTANFEKLVDPSFAYTPYVPEAEKSIKVPAWMNDVRYYHNRGNSTFEGESSTLGDFVGLDDFMTEDPRVVEGFIDIYKQWITDYKIDGFRIDTAKHVNPSFWRAFLPAVKEHAKAEGIPNFYVFGEAVYWTTADLAAFMTEAGFETSLDFPMMKALKDQLLANESGHALHLMLNADKVYPGGEKTARGLPVFVGNHDMGRYAGELLKKRPDLTDEQRYRNVRLAHAFLFFSRGAPVIYYGDEQGFTGDGGDQDAREDMFPSKVAIYNDNELIATDATTAQSNFDVKHPLYHAFAGMAAAYKAHPALRHGALVVRHSEKAGGGLFAFSRIDAATGDEYLFAANLGLAPREAFVEVDPRSQRWTSVIGRCEKKSAAQGSLKVRLGPQDFLVCRAARSNTGTDGR
ncbi:MAG TPA: alpha-amylase [Parvularcula sp.]|nr:alpha-amylase [Parvularcula sp.]